MNYVNPIGRTESETIQPYACMCNTTARLATGKSSSDTCTWCGCICGVILSNGNFTTASTTNRKS